ncbi:MAG: MFS transporter, partial [Microthrixaceae bacterium]
PSADDPSADDLTAVDTVGTATFSAAEGPYRTYERHVSWEPVGPGNFRMTQWVRFWPAIPVFAPIWHRFMRKALRDPKPPLWRPIWALPDRLTPRQSTVLASMALFHVVGGMLYAFLTNVLTFASADLGDGTAGEQSVILAVSRVGIVLTIATMAFADRVGRRRIAVGAAAAAVAFTLASAVAPSLVILTVLQTTSRNLAIAAMLAADTVSVEELPAGSRAAAQGLGALSYGLGAGVVVLSLPLADLGDSGWRLVFGASALCIPLVWIAAKHLPESTRFAERDTSVRARKVSPARFALLAALFFLLNAFVAPSSQLQNDYLRTDRGFAGSRITLFIIVTGMPGLFGILVGGRLADRRGRRLALVPGLLALGGFGALFFALSGAPMWVAATLAAMLGTLSVPALGVLAPELFPTARRGAARGGLSAMGTAGSAAGLLLAGVLVDSLGYGNAFLWLAIGPLIAAALALGVPETSGVELEDLNEQRGGEDPASP